MRHAQQIIIIIIIICVSIRCHSKGNEYSIEPCSHARTTHSHGSTTP
jgi:hypothetical protein